MSNLAPNEFQQNCIQTCWHFLKTAGLLKDLSFEMIPGQERPCFKTSFTLEDHHEVKLYIYPDAAGFSINHSVRELCIRSEFESDDHLITTYTSKLHIALSACMV